MKQTPLFHDDDRSPPARLGIPGSQPTLNREQKRFNRLIAGIEAQRELLQRWRDYGSVYQQRYADEIEPLTRRLREARIGLVAVFDRALAREALGKRQRDKLRDLLLAELSSLLDQAEDAELLRLYDQHAGVPFHEARQDEMAYLRAMAAEVFGLQPGAGGDAATPEELMDRIAQGLDDDRREQAPPAGKPRKKGEKGAAREALREQLAQDAGQAIRALYRKLVKQLHPDRERDAAEQARKTGLMQQANQAYASRDLLGLLQLQLRVEQIDSAALTGLEPRQLAHYNHVLEEQLQTLQQEVSDTVAPFLRMLDSRMPRELTPEAVQRAVDADLRAMKATLKNLKADIVAFRDVRNLQDALRNYRVGQSRDDELELLRELQTSARSRRRR